MAELIELSDYQEEPDLEDLGRDQLEELLEKVREQIAQLDAKEPRSMNSPAYEAWGDRHEELEDMEDEILDRLDELGDGND